MSFKEVNYFQSFVTNSITKYKASPTTFKEDDIRTIFSRAYYTMFLHCRDTLSLEQEKSLSVHQKVKNSIKNHDISSRIHNSHEIRKKADYNNINYYNNPGRVLKELEAIKREMNYILGKTKEDLNK